MIDFRHISKFAKGVSLLILIVSLTLIQRLNAQTDSLTYSEEIQQDSMVQYLTPLEYAFMMHEETQWMFKINLAYSNTMGSFKNLFGFEHKVGKDFSLSAGIGFGFKQEDFSESENDFSSREFSAILESRWYYNMKRRIAENKSKRNLSGNYIGLGARYSRVSKILYSQSFGIVPIGDTIFNLVTDYISIYAKWGIQRRFLKRGYFDFGLNTGVETTLNKSNTSFFLSTYIDAGIAFAKDKQKLDHDKICPVLKCYSLDRFILKSNLLGLFSIKAGYFGFATTFNPEIVAELKLGSSPFSLSAGVKINTFYSHLVNFNEVPSNLEFEIQPTLETRWYYNLNKRIIKGKTGNGFSANYFALGGSYNYKKNPSLLLGFSNNFGPLIFSLKSQSAIGYYILWGIQRTYAKHFYFDVNVGFFNGNEKNTSEDKTTFNQTIFKLIANLSIGYRF